MNKTAYQSPEMDVIDLCAENVICASSTDVTVSTHGLAILNWNGSGKEPAASGKMFFAYEGGNDLTKYTGTSTTYFGTNLIYGNDYWHPTTYTYADGILSAEITRWVPQTEFQVVVTDIDPAKYELKCSNLMKISGFGVAGQSVYTANNA